ncbi:MAG: dihydroorotate dehydrogenase [Actinobacteria bacterium]|nr:dihydroorotate dehydrogenase [Actinomycetota bacterium]
MAIDSATSLAKLNLIAPVLTASGCAAAGKELDQFFDITKIGGIVTKSIMLEARSGRPTPRMAETPSGMLNSIGLQGPGIDSFIEKDLAWLHERGVTTIVSIAGNNIEEFGRLASKLRDHPAVAAIEINISCPNVANRGLVFACNTESAADVVSVVRRNVSPGMPLLAKLSPDVTDIVEIAQSVKAAGADGVSVINTLLGMVIDQKTLRPVLGGRTGGLSGPAIRPVALRCVFQIHAAMPSFPILGMGGIRNGKDALEFIAAGASAISVGTATFGDPSAPMRIQNELLQDIENHGFESVSDVIGVAHKGDN